MSSSYTRNFPLFTDLAGAYAWLDSHINYERNLDKIQYDNRTFTIEPFRERLESLGRPHEGIRSIHIAGTRGKGSTALMLEALIASTGAKVATFTSPHINEYRERVRVDGRPIRGEAFCRALEQAASVAPDVPASQSFKTVFELLTVTFFLAARSAGADWLVVETGLGGRLDTTNALGPGPVALTRIGLEHTHLLGDTIEQIAAEKAAILKPGGWGVYSRQSDDGKAERVFRERARETGAELTRADEICTVSHSEFGSSGVSVGLEIEGRGVDLRLPIYGPFQIDNLQTAAAMFAELNRRGLLSVSPGAAYSYKSLESVVLSGKFEPLGTCGGDEPVIIADSAHCPASGAALAEAMRAHFGAQPAIAVVGMMADKNHRGFFEALSGWAGWKAVVCYEPPISRSFSAAALAAEAEPFFANVSACPDLDMALQSAQEMAEKSGRIVATGSIYGISRIREWVEDHGPHIPRGKAQT